MSLPNDFYIEVAKGNVSGFSAKEIVGSNSNLDGTQDIWPVGGNITHVSTAALLYVSSDSAADVNKAITIVGLDANYDEITEVITTNGTDGRTRVTGTKAFLRVNSVSGPVCAGNIFVYYLSAVTAGVPDTMSKVQSILTIGEVNAACAIYTVPRNKNVYITSMRWTSTGSLVEHNVSLNVSITPFGGTTVVDKEVKYVDLETGVVDGQVLFIDKPIILLPKTDFKVTGTLSGVGTDLNVQVIVNCIAEDITVSPILTSVISLAEYQKKLTGLTRTLTIQTYTLIGLDEYPVLIPTSVNLDDVLITLPESRNYTVGEDTTVAFELAYFTTGKLVITSKKAVLTIMRCIDSAAAIDYVLAPTNTLIDLVNVKNVNYLHA